MSVSVCFLFFNLFSFSVAAEGSSNRNPRVVLAAEDIPIKNYTLHGINRRVELIPGTHDHSIFVGGHGRVWYIDFNVIKKSKEVDISVLEKETRISRAKAPPNYDVTTLHRVNATSLFVCATNGEDRKCCFMSTALEMKCYDGMKARGIAPFNVTEQAPSLYLEGEVYAAASRGKEENTLAIRRIGKNDIWPATDKKEQRYVSMVLSGPREDPLQDRVYTFFVQKSSNEDMEASSWTSWVTQVCKADMGGSKAFLQMAWTSRLNARLSCGIRDRKLLFNQLLDVTVLQEADWRESRVYGLFRNSWGKTAVCVYRMADIDNVFKTSGFKGFTGTVPDPRPGEECVEDSRKLPPSVLRHIKENPDLEDWVWPVQGSAPLMVSDYDYRNIRVDRVKGGGPARRDYTVLLLSLESGSVHKVVEHAGKSFIIAELQPFRNRTNIKNMLLPPSAGKLYVSSSRKVVEVDLQDCQRYGQECEDCVQARDPYCSWNGTHCAATAESRNPIQDVMHGNHSVCWQGDNGISAMYMHSEVAEVPSVMVPPESRHFLRCPMFSTHAEYSWFHNEKRRECLQAEGWCLLLFDPMKPAHDGNYTCMSWEGGYVRTLAQYRLQTQSRAPSWTPSTLALVCLLLSLALMW